MDYHFIYLIKEKQDIDNNESIFKIGKSTQENTRRVKSYPSGSHLLLQVACNDCHTMESFLIQEFKKLFILARGREYFKGDFFTMINLIFCIVQNEVNHSNIEYIITNDYNLSLYVNSKDDYIKYSFNNKDNILDEYHRELTSEKNKFKHLEIKYNTYKYQTIDKIKELETRNKNLTNTVGWKFQENKINELSSLNKSIQISNSELLKSNYDYKKKLIDKDKKINELSSLNKSIQISNSELLNSNNDYKKNLIDKDKKIISLENHPVHKNYQTTLQKSLSLEYKIRQLNEEINNKNILIDKLNIKNNIIIENNKLLSDECNNNANNTIKMINDKHTSLIKENSNLKLQLVDNQKKYNLDKKILYDKTKKSYYILYGYLLYTMLYHLYQQPYIITNWLLLCGGTVIYHY